MDLDAELDAILQEIDTMPAAAQNKDKQGSPPAPPCDGATVAAKNVVVALISAYGAAAIAETRKGVLPLHTGMQHWASAETTERCTTIATSKPRRPPRLRGRLGADTGCCREARGRGGEREMGIRRRRFGSRLAAPGLTALTEQEKNERQPPPKTWWWL